MTGKNWPVTFTVDGGNVDRGAKITLTLHTKQCELIIITQEMQLVIIRCCSIKIYSSVYLSIAVQELN